MFWYKGTIAKKLCFLQHKKLITPHIHTLRFVFFLVAMIFALSKKRTDFAGWDMEYFFRAFIKNMYETDSRNESHFLGEFEIVGC